MASPSLVAPPACVQPLSGASGDVSTSAGSNAPYNAPTYFPADYFYGGSGGSSAPPSPASGQSPYNAPTYFPPTYFSAGGAASTVSTPAVESAAGRDGPSYAALAAGLGALGVFDAVAFGDATRRNAAGANSYPLAVITPKGWEEADDTDPTLLVRRVLFTIRVVIRVQDDSRSFAELDRLAALVHARVHRSDLGGGCLPALTRIRAGRYEPSSQYPEWSVELDGEFTLLIDPTADPAAG